MTFTTANRDSVESILTPIRSGRSNLVRRSERSLGGGDFMKRLLSRADRLDLSAFRIDGTIVIFKPMGAQWLANPQSITAPT